MSTYQRADETVHALAFDLINKYHEPLKVAEVSVDIVMAYGARNEDGELTGVALSKNGIQCRGLCRIVPLKDRAMGRADAEISLDGDWWPHAPILEQAALLDHEIYHIKVLADRDDLGRPKLKLRKHDFEVGWFAAVAARHGKHSIEQQQARQLMDEIGQFFWPDLCPDRVLESHVPIYAYEPGPEATIQISTPSQTSSPIGVQQFAQRVIQIANEAQASNKQLSVQP